MSEKTISLGAANTTTHDASAPSRATQPRTTQPRETQPREAQPSLLIGVARSLAFLALLYAVLTGIYSVVAPHHPMMTRGFRFANQFGYTALPINSLDMIVLGDSSGQSSFSPDMMEQLTGVRCFNAARPQQKPAESVQLVTDSFRYDKIKVVVAEMNSFFHGTDIRMVVQDLGDSYLPLMRYHDNWKLIARGQMDDSPVPTPNRGYKWSNLMVPYKGGDYMKDRGEKTPFTPFAEYYLGKLQKVCEDNGAILVLVSAPNAHEFNLAKHNTVTEWAKTHHVPYYDMNEADSQVGIDWSKDSRDAGTHLNYLGATKASTWLATRLYDDFGIGHAPTPGAEAGGPNAESTAPNAEAKGK